ncbi:neugrin domain-containing protein [Cavenderia fasciculata]|uniref:Neugrin domain-containing protein n=1 Tax=Cavenderia fasciculata TaxID=261658 RepID=F4PGM0_CACFS|nr:neugrin domain-containing protein [Cavenderia fasciculata]EGG24854.1 neugrin domain-containing protein [Cavenderia fasciculata]|eukprot:XP_004362705.1 neugrin domain-containing protein [Cavenderia fasciculata]
MLTLAARKHNQYKVLSSLFLSTTGSSSSSYISRVGSTGGLCSFSTKRKDDSHGSVNDITYTVQLTQDTSTRDLVMSLKNQLKNPKKKTKNNNNNTEKKKTNTKQTQQVEEEEEDDIFYEDENDDQTYFIDEDGEEYIVDFDEQSDQPIQPIQQQQQPKQTQQQQQQLKSKKSSLILSEFEKEYQMYGMEGMEDHKFNDQDADVADMQLSLDEFNIDQDNDQLFRIGEKNDFELVSDKDLVENKIRLELDGLEDEIEQEEEIDPLEEAKRKRKNLVNIIREKYGNDADKIISKIDNKEKYGNWDPKRKLSRDDMNQVKQLHKQDPDIHTIDELSKQFKVSASSIYRIIRSKWEPTEERLTKQEQNKHKHGIVVNPQKDEKYSKKWEMKKNNNQNNNNQNNNYNNKPNHYNNNNKNNNKNNNNNFNKTNNSYNNNNKSGYSVKKDNNGGQFKPKPNLLENQRPELVVANHVPFPTKSTKQLKMVDPTKSLKSNKISKFVSNEEITRRTNRIKDLERSISE